MSTLAKIAVSPFQALLGVFKKPKVPAQQAIAAPRAISTNSAVEAQRRDDERRRRRGIGANILNGASGAEAQTAGGKVLLGQ